MRQLRVFVVLAAFLMVLGLPACNMVQINNGVVTINFGISEETVNSIIQRTLGAGQTVESEFLFQEITGVDLVEPDTVRVFGNFRQNNEVVSGSYDLTVASADGRLLMRVASVDVPGIGVDDPRIVAANNALSRAFQDQAQSQADGRFTSVRVEEGELRFSIEAPLNQQ